MPIGSRSKLWSMKSTSASSRIVDCTTLRETSPRFSADISLPGVAISTFIRVGEERMAEREMKSYFTFSEIIELTEYNSYKDKKK